MKKLILPAAALLALTSASLTFAEGYVADGVRRDDREVDKGVEHDSKEVEKGVKHDNEERRKEDKHIDKEAKKHL